MKNIAGLPAHYRKLRKKYPAYFDSLDALGEKARQAGPLDEKTAQLIQLAAAAAVRSEGGVHSHARRSLLAGARMEELHHAIILITSTVGFPTVAAALSWIEDMPRKQQ